MKKKTSASGNTKAPLPRRGGKSAVPPTPGSGPVAAATAPNATRPAVAQSVAKGRAKARASKAPKAVKSKRLSALDGAAKVLADAGTPMSAKQMIVVMSAKGLWESKGGKTPAATVYAAIIREIEAKGKEARFVKSDRGLFAARGA